MAIGRNGKYMSNATGGRVMSSQMNQNGNASGIMINSGINFDPMQTRGNPYASTQPDGYMNTHKAMMKSDTLGPR